MQEVPIGKLGVLHMLPGIYVYVGSALGPGGLAARVDRHALPEKVLHWHIDYLRAETRLLAVWYARGTKPRECHWSKIIERAARAQIPLEGFGCVRLPLPVASSILCESASCGGRSIPVEVSGITVCPRLSRWISDRSTQT